MATKSDIFDQWLLDTGAANNAGTITAYTAGTLNKKDMWTDAAETVAHSNPLTLDSAGRTTIYMEAGYYDFVIKDSDGNTLSTLEDIAPPLGGLDTGEFLLRDGSIATTGAFTFGREITVKGAEGADGTIDLWADEGDDNADKWRMIADSAGNFQIASFSTGAYVNAINVSGAGKVGIGKDVPTELLHLAGANPNLLIEGSIEPSLVLYDSGGTSDDSIVEFAVSDEKAKFRALQDSGVVDVDNMLVFDLNSGKVGVGESDPQAKLTIDSTQATDLSTMYLQVGADGNESVGDYFGIGLGYTSSSRVEPPAAIAYVIDSSTGGTSGDLVFAVRADGGAIAAPDERARITKEGYFGIGNTDPGNLLEVSESNDSPKIELSTWSTTDAHQGIFRFQKSASSTINTLSATADGENLGRMDAAGVDTGGTSRVASYILFEGDGAPDADSVPGRIIFSTSDLDDAGSPTERMRIDSSGNVSLPNDTGQLRFGASDDARLYYDGLDLQIKKVTDENGGDILYDNADTNGGHRFICNSSEYLRMIEDENTIVSSKAFQTGGAANFASFDANGKLSFAGSSNGVRNKYSTANVSDPPTDAELDSAFGTPGTVGTGFLGILNDNNADTDVWLCFASGSNWYYLQGTQAV